MLKLQSLVPSARLLPVAVFVKTTIEKAQKADKLAAKVRRQRVVPGASSVATALMDLEWGRDELLEQAAQCGRTEFKAALQGFPTLLRRGRELRLIA